MVDDDYAVSLSLSSRVSYPIFSTSHLGLGNTRRYVCTRWLHAVLTDPFPISIFHIRTY
jgi:hypothetical protein